MSRTNQRQAAAPQGPIKLAWKGHTEFRHDLFKLEVAVMKKNVSYKKFEPDLKNVEHAHFFHSHDMKGKVLLHSQAVGGHFHEVKVVWGKEADGTPFIEKLICGEPLRQVQKRTKGGRVKTVIEPVRFETGTAAVDDTDEDERTGFEVDDHRHELTYMGSEMISPEKLKQKKEADKAALAGMMAAQPGLFAPPDPKTGKQAASTGGDENSGTQNVDGTGATITDQGDSDAGGEGAKE